MICREIYDMALSFISEPGVSPGGDDYLRRAPYMLSAVCHEMRELDRAYRRSRGMGKAPFPSGIKLPLEEEFPLCERICPAAAYYLASALVFDENAELSDRLHDKYAEAVTAVYKEIPGRIHGIRDVYFGEESEA